MGRNERAAAVLFIAALTAVVALLYADWSFSTLPTSPALIFATAGLLPLFLARMPRVAGFLCILLCGTAAAVSLTVSAPAGPALAAFSGVYGWVITAAIRDRQRKARTLAEAERQIRTDEEILALALNESGEAAGGWLWETDQAGRLTHVSPGLAAGLGRPASTLLGKDFTKLFSDEDGPGWDRLLLSINALQPVDRAVELSLYGCRMWWQITARPVSGADGSHQGYRGAAHNITAERLARRKLAEERDALLRETAGKSRFLAMIADEFRTPLDTIVGYSELLLSPSASFVKDAQHDEHLKTILDTSRHLQSVAADILDATRIEKGSLQLVEQEADAAEISEVAVKMCRDAAEKADVTIMASVIDGIELNCDVSRIKQIVVNLVSHAVQSSTSGGTVRLDFETPADGSLVIAVHHAGPGIPAGDLARIFQSFMPADHGAARRFGGMGLGLPIARQIALLHGGDVTIESAEGAGTTARLILPASRVTLPLEVRSESDCAA